MRLHSGRHEGHGLRGKGAPSAGIDGHQGGLVGLPEAAVYCATKGGVNTLTKQLALEWAPHGVNVNALAPTFVETPGTKPILDDPERRADVLSKIPLGHVATIDDVAVLDEITRSLAELGYPTATKP